MLHVTQFGKCEQRSKEGVQLLVDPHCHVSFFCALQARTHIQKEILKICNGGRGKTVQQR